MARPLFLMWYDDNAKLASIKKIEAAIAAYAERFRVQPNLVLISEGEPIDYPGVEIRRVMTIAPNNYWVGFERHENELAAA